MSPSRKTLLDTPAPASGGTGGSSGFDVSLRDAQKAVVQLRRDLNNGRRRLFGDLETAVTSARRDLGRTGSAVQRDLGQLGEAITPHSRRQAKPANRAVTKARKAKAKTSAAEPARKPSADPLSRRR